MMHNAKKLGRVGVSGMAVVLLIAAVHLHGCSRSTRGVTATGTSREAAMHFAMTHPEVVRKTGPVINVRDISHSALTKPSRLTLAASKHIGEMWSFKVVGENTSVYARFILHPVKGGGWEVVEGKTMPWAEYEARKDNMVQDPADSTEVIANKNRR